MKRSTTQKLVRSDPKSCLSPIEDPAHDEFLFTEGRAADIPLESFMQLDYATIVAWRRFNAARQYELERARKWPQIVNLRPFLKSLQQTLDEWHALDESTAKTFKQPTEDVVDAGGLLRDLDFSLHIFDGHYASLSGKRESYLGERQVISEMQRFWRYELERPFETSPSSKSAKFTFALLARFGSRIAFERFLRLAEDLHEVRVYPYPV